MGIPRIVAHFLFGVFLPAFTLGFEIVTGFSAEIYINPIPSLLHVIIVGLVPLANAIHLFRCALGQTTRAWDLHLSSLSITLALAYTIAYLPISPFAVLGIIAYGLGFLPLTPLIALFCAYRLRKQLKRNYEASSAPGWRHVCFGSLAGLFLLGLASTPHVVADYALAKYAHANLEGKKDAVQLLRRFGSEEVLLRACYRRARPVFFWGGGSSLDTTEARQLFYRVTGESFNENRMEMKSFLSVRGDAFDRDLGGEQVGQRIDSIHLKESRLDGILTPESGTGYVEWTMVFQNDHPRREHEARMLLATPKGAVASRVTLWVNGEPREAAFGSKAKVRAAYQAVAVRQRRDPILVNWAGPDLLLVQCFPILPDGGEMKIRIGMSFPLEVDSDNRLSYHYPAIVAENFNLADDLEHSLWYEEKVGSEVFSPPISTRNNDQLRSDVNHLRSTSDNIHAQFISPHPTTESPLTLAATIAPKESPAPDTIVIDGSLKMRAHKERIARWLEGQKSTVDLYLASDEVQHFQAEGPTAAQWLRKQKFAGGQDNVPALIEAIAQLQPIASSTEPKKIYWFSGPQPIQLSGTERIKQYYERRALPIEVVACLSSREYNALYELAPLSYSDRLYLSEDGSKLEKPTVRFEELPPQATATHRGSSHAHRIWLADQTRVQAGQVYQKQAALGPGAFKNKIAELANRAAEAYLVTQLSGAVVLETDRQYKENDLEAGDPNAVPSVPEFKQFALILSLVSFCWVVASRRR